jgi:hypothetical protein
MKSRIIHTPEELARLLAKPTVTVSEAAAIAGVGRTNFVNALRRGELDLPVREIGARKIIVTAALKRWLGMEEPNSSARAAPAGVIAAETDEPAPVDMDVPWRGESGELLTRWP